MRVYCYCVYTANGRGQRLWETIQDQGWICATADTGVTYYYIPEHLRAWCLLIDPTMRHYSQRDLIV
jgi:hypothetical protein